MPSIDDIYCKFGFVAEAAQLLETELGTLLLNEEVTDEGLIENKNPELATSIYKKINKQTLGRLINNTKSKLESVERLEALLSSALKERNRLAHSFYMEHNFRLHAEADEGRIIMLEDLESMYDIIFDAYKAVMLISGIDLDDSITVESELANTSLPGHVKL